MNKLIDETSPYLIQHANNPVDWYPWSEEALEAAKSQDKPILLSIGYAACHWCHVMAHESFEDPETAKIMNQYFVNIKVDREVRPDLDKVYQQLHQILMQRQGGWPLTVFLSPDNLKPFFSGTYFPKEKRYGLHSFKDILKIVGEYYRKEKKTIQAGNLQLDSILPQIENQNLLAALKIKKAPLYQACDQWLHIFDTENGGFKGAPKFPMPAVWESVLYIGDDKTKRQLMLTLEKMSQGGIYDHIGGGFFRYAVDEKWQIPHFEKMLYDNAQLISLYAIGYGISHNDLLKEIAQESIQWANAELRSPEGAYYASLNADSEGVEGKYYVWDQEEISSLVTKREFNFLTEICGFDSDPNFEGKWHLTVKKPDFEFATVENPFDTAKEKLKAYRDKRQKPSLDDKILCAWNALMLKALSVSAIIFNNSEYAKNAHQLFQAIKKHLFKDNQLWVSYKQGKTQQPGFLDDYAFMLDACWYYLQLNFDEEVLTFSQLIADKLIAAFWDNEKGGFYFTSNAHEKLVFRPKSWGDDVLPSGAAFASLALNRFGYLLNNTTYTEIAEKSLKYTDSLLEQNASHYPNLLNLLYDYHHAPSIVIAYGRSFMLKQAQEIFMAHYNPHRFVFCLNEDAKIPDKLKHYVTNKDLAVYICQGFVCNDPITNIDVLKDYL